MYTLQVTLIRQISATLNLLERRLLTVFMFFIDI
jgi:hypothetical protein